MGNQAYVLFYGPVRSFPSWVTDSFFPVFFVVLCCMFVLVLFASQCSRVVCLYVFVTQPSGGGGGAGTGAGGVVCVIGIVL